MSVKVNELMTAAVVTAQPHHSVGHVRELLDRNSVSAVPIVDSEGRPVGIASSELRERKSDAATYRPFEGPADLLKK